MNKPLTVASCIEENCSDNSRDPSTKGQNEYKQDGTATFIYDGKWREDYTNNGSENPHK